MSSGRILSGLRFKVLESRVGLEIRGSDVQTEERRTDETPRVNGTDGQTKRHVSHADVDNHDT